MHGIRGWSGSLGFALAYAAAMLLGRALPIDGQSLSVVWPACGVAALWLLSVRHDWPVVDVVLLGAVTFAVNFLTGATVWLSGLFVVVNLVQALLAVALLRRFLPDLWGCGGRQTVDRLRTVFVVLAIALVTSAVAALVAGAGLTTSVGVDPTPLSLLLHTGRNTFGFVVVFTAAHLIAHALRDPEARRRTTHTLQARRPELVALVVVTGVVYATAFVPTTLPLSFVPMTVTLWAGLRFPSPVVAVHGVACSIIALSATLLEHGPLMLADNLVERGLLVQLLMSVIVVKGLALAASRNETALLVEKVEADGLAAAEQTAVLSTVIEAMTQGLVVLDSRGQVLRANTEARRVMAGGAFRVGLGGAEPYGEPLTWDDVAEIVVCERTTCAFDLVVESGPVPAVVHLRATPLRRGHDEDAMVVVLDDVTADRAAREELTSFASSVAHDLRSPLTSVKGWAEQLRETMEVGVVDQRAAMAMADRVVANADRMQALIRDLLEHATSEGAEVTLRLGSVSQLAADVCEAVGVKRNATIQRTPLVRCDKALVSQLLLNLVQNAVKYAGEGVAPRLHLSGGMAGDQVVFTLTDNGPGIPDADRERVFERFFRGTHDLPGTGLGLSICRTIVARHGGSIRVEPGPGGLGSSFVFSLPAAVPAPAPVPAPALAPVIDLTA